MKKKLTALVLQGGGALGAYELGAVKALYEQKDFAPDIIAGVSIGAFSAAVLAGAKRGPIEGLEQLWQLLTTPDYPFVPDYTQLLMSMAYNQGMYFPNPSSYLAPLKNTCFYNTQPLFNTLSEVIDFDKLNSASAPHVILTATNIQTGALDMFTNYQDGQSIAVEHIVASGSMPPSFPMVDIDNSDYWDGGLFSNTPLQPAIKQLELMSGDADCEREIVLVDLFPKKGAAPQNMPDVYNRMFELTFESKIAADIEQIHNTNELIDLFAQIDGELAKNSKIRKLPLYQEVMKYQKIHKLTIIRQTAQDDVLGEAVGTADFREKTINRRVEQGYQDAKTHLAI